MEVHKRSYHSWAGISAILLITLLFTLIQIQHSLVAGRLADPPTWDDVVYLDDALIRLQQIQTDSFRGFLIGMIRNPPHSVYSVAMATLGFYLLGVHDWVPYAANGLWLAALLIYASGLIQRTVLWQRALLLMFVLTMPLTAVLITEYRPDLVWGLTSAMAVFSVLESRWIGSSRKRQLTAGLWLAAALVCKTSTFPLTLLTVGIAWMLAIYCDWADDVYGGSQLGRSGTPLKDTRPSMGFVRWVFDRKIAAAILWTALPTLVLVVPYYVVEAKSIFAYIYQTLSGPDRNRWVMRGTWLDHARYFLDGGGRVMMRNHFYLLAVILIGGGLLWVRLNLMRRNCGTLRRGLGIASVTFIAYLEPAVNPAKNPFFGAEFQFLLLLSAVVLIATLVSSTSKNIRSAGNALLSIVTLTAIACFRFPAPVGVAREPDTSHLVQAIVSVTQASPIREPDVFLAVIGNRLNTSTLDYASRKTGRKIHFTEPAYNASLAQIISNLDRHDFIVAGETGVGDVIIPWVPNRAADETLKVIEADPHFERLLELKTSTGKRLFIFRRVALSLNSLSAPAPPTATTPATTAGFGSAATTITGIVSASTAR